MDNPTFKKLGFWLLILGIAGLLATVIIPYTVWADREHGALPAASFLVIMLGFVFCFPSMLEETAGQLSTMRIVVFAVTMVFAVIYIKFAWNTASFQNFTIDKSWIYILGLAFGSKAFQKFAEEEDKDNGKGKGDGEKGKEDGEKGDK